MATGKRVFITGGSMGIGQALALALAQQGAQVVICARGQAALDATLTALRAAAPNGTFGAVAADVTDEHAMVAAAQKGLELMGGAIDLLICTTGMSVPGVDAELQMTDYRRMMEVNFFGHVHTYRAFAEIFRKQGRGDIVFLSSMLATFAVWGYGAYSASKFAITGLAQALRQEMASHGVRVKLFFPPTTDTPGLAKENENKPALLHELEMGSSLNVTHPPAKVAASILKWLPTSKFFGMVAWDSKLQWFMARHFPELTLRMADSELRAAEKRLAKKQAAAAVSG